MRVIVILDDRTAHDESFTARYLSPIAVATPRASPTPPLSQLWEGRAFSWFLRDARAVSVLWDSSRAR